MVRTILAIASSAESEFLDVVRDEDEVVCPSESEGPSEASSKLVTLGRLSSWMGGKVRGEGGAPSGCGAAGCAAFEKFNTSITASGLAIASCRKIPDSMRIFSHARGRPEKPVGFDGSSRTCTTCLVRNGRDTLVLPAVGRRGGGVTGDERIALTGIRGGLAPDGEAPALALPPRVTGASRSVRRSASEREESFDCVGSSIRDWDLKRGGDAEGDAAEARACKDATDRVGGRGRPCGGVRDLIGLLLPRGSVASVMNSSMPL